VGRGSDRFFHSYRAVLRARLRITTTAVENSDSPSTLRYGRGDLAKRLERRGRRIAFIGDAPAAKAGDWMEGFFRARPFPNT